ncbi:hypothetical protein L519_0654 [Bordetella bronchiseptica MBORD678]|nr:hypothetical protein L519_0654 [Bordetella bronchiseptica MBORD678]
MLCRSRFFIYHIFGIEFHKIENWRSGSHLPEARPAPPAACDHHLKGSRS